jgi:hypothetical protein
MRRWCFYPPGVRAALERWEKETHYVRIAWISVPGSPYKFLLAVGEVEEVRGVTLNFDPVPGAIAYEVRMERP